jgi:hypothetical protein
MKVKLKQSAIQALYSGLQALDTYERVIGEGAAQKAVQEPFVLGALRFDIALNLNKLRPSVEAFETARKELAKEIFGEIPDAVRNGSEQMKDFAPKFEEMMAREEELDLIQIPRDALNLDKNPIPLMALAAIAPIVAE